MSTNDDELARIDGKLILGAGEVTGHLHAITEPKARAFVLQSTDAAMLRLELPMDTPLRHEKDGRPAEHRDVWLPIGDPIVSHLRQYTPDGSWAPVED